MAVDGFQCSGFDDVGRLEEAGFSDLALPQMVREGLKFQLVYIDGSHRFEDVFCDFYFVRYLVAVGGYVFFDDSSDWKVAKVVRFIRKNRFEFLNRFRFHAIAERQLLAGSSMRWLRLSTRLNSPSSGRLRVEIAPAKEKLQSF